MRIAIFTSLALALAACSSSPTTSGSSSGSSTSGGTSSTSGGSTSGGSTSGSTSGSSGTTGGGHLQTVFTIVMENANWDAFQGNTAQAPYLNNTLLPMSAYATQYFNAPGIHPSEPNYLWMEAGTNFGILNDNSVQSNHQSTTAHLVTELGSAGISWKAYAESISGNGCPLSNNYPFAVRHVPVLFFDDVTNSLDPNSAFCKAHVRPYSELETDLQSGTVARYNFITPNLCSDGHDSCAPLNDQIKQIDTWLSTEIPKITASQAYQQGGVIFITWDEGEGGSDGPIGMIVLSPQGKGAGYSNAIHYTHSSYLRTVQEIFGVTPLLGDAANSNDLSDLFSRFP